MTPPDAAGPRRSIVTADPLNAEAPLAALGPGPTPPEAFYVRSNFATPEVDAATWRLRIHGCVERPRVIDLEELRELPRITRRVTLECAGNGRKQVDPQPPGTPWGLGAAGTADFTGVPLRDLLGAAGVRDDAVACVFSGADGGEVEDGSRTRFRRSLPVEVARSDGPLLALAMNGAPLAREHGHPVRLVVPRWYAVASVKWLVDIEVVARPFEGWFQTNRYVYRDTPPPAGPAPDGAGTPVTTMRVRSLITGPGDGDRVGIGSTRVTGVAWSGEAPVARVEVQAEGGAWTPARLDGPSEAGVAVGWHADIDLAPGEHRLRVRAVDGAGRGQPHRSAFNALGYGNNGVHEIRVTAG